VILHFSKNYIIIICVTLKTVVIPTV